MSSKFLYEVHPRPFNTFISPCVGTAEDTQNQFTADLKVQDNKLFEGYI